MTYLTEPLLDVAVVEVILGRSIRGNAILTPSPRKRNERSSYKKKKQILHPDLFFAMFPGNMQ
jgi:hypothetical protein